jgi:hypothetical protein
VAVGRIDKQPGTVRLVDVSIRALLFEPGQPPGSYEPVAVANIDVAELVARPSVHPTSPESLWA